MDYKKLIHDESAFRRETLETRMQDYGFKNIIRIFRPFLLQMRGM